MPRNESKSRRLMQKASFCREHQLARATLLIRWNEEVETAFKWLIHCFATALISLQFLSHWMRFHVLHNCLQTCGCYDELSFVVLLEYEWNGLLDSKVLNLNDSVEPFQCPISVNRSLLPYERGTDCELIRLYSEEKIITHELHYRQSHKHNFWIINLKNCTFSRLLNQVHSAESE
jgi:hypothetical protein